MEQYETNFEFEKKLWMNHACYSHIESYIRATGLLLKCMIETNELHKKDCEFFRLDFRPTSFYEDLTEGLCFHLKWGNKSQKVEK